MIIHDITYSWCFKYFGCEKTFIIHFYNVLQQFRVKSMVSIPLLWALFLMSGHDIRSWVDISQDSVGGKKVVREVWGNLLICFLIQWAQKIWFGRRFRSKEPTLVSCPDISKWDISWIRFGHFSHEKNWPPFFFRNKTLIGWNKFYTWSHLKIYYFLLL